MLIFEMASAAVSATSLDALTSWASPIRTHPYAYPVLEALHIVGIALLLGNLVLVELRVWGAGAKLPIQDLARLSLTLVLVGFGLAALTGTLMFASNAGELISNRAFVIKMGLLMTVGFNAAIFHSRQGLQRLDAVARAQTALSLLLWLAVVAMGRAIAYV
jgi:hypothetical protein